MKKNILVILVVLMVAALAVMPAAAKNPVIKGEITAIAASQVTILTHRDQTVVVVTPPGFDTTTLAIGDRVIVKGKLQADGSLLADWVRKIGKDASEDEDAAEGSKRNSAYCDADKKQEPHPLATSLAERFDVTPAWVMEKFCGGYSMGAIMLALKTHAINGADADELLEKRAGGQGWGAIWQELKMIGHEKDVKTPPGLLKKPFRNK